MYQKGKNVTVLSLSNPREVQFQHFPRRSALRENYKLYIQNYKIISLRFLRERNILTGTKLCRIDIKKSARAKVPKFCMRIIPHMEVIM